jgi:hypothetical protein
MAIGGEIEQWKNYRSYERPILQGAGSNRHIDVRISSSDCVLTSRPDTKVPKGEISDWYECPGCGRIHEMAASKARLTECSHCGGEVILRAEPFQTTQFSRSIHDGANRADYAGAAPIQKASCSEETIFLRDLYADPNSRFQEGGTGFLRIPLDEPRSTRADAPGWLHQRQSFFRTLKASRAARAEQIFCGFYLGDKTDTLIAETLGWRKDSVKKERTVLLRRGNRFFEARANEPPP